MNWISLSLSFCTNFFDNLSTIGREQQQFDNDYNIFSIDFFSILFLKEKIAFFFSIDAFDALEYLTK